MQNGGWEGCHSMGFQHDIDRYRRSLALSRLCPVKSYPNFPSFITTSPDLISLACWISAALTFLLYSISAIKVKMGFQGGRLRHTWSQQLVNLYDSVYGGDVLSSISCSLPPSLLNISTLLAASSFRLLAASRSRCLCSRISSCFRFSSLVWLNSRQLVWLKRD